MGVPTWKWFGIQCIALQLQEPLWHYMCVADHQLLDIHTHLCTLKMIDLGSKNLLQ